MARQDTYVVKLEAETGQLDKSIENVGKNLDNVGQRGESAMGLLDQATGGATGKLSSLYSGFKSAKAGVQSFNLGLKGTKAALISTGIGAFIVLLGEVIANWETITGFFKDKTRENALQREVDLLDKTVTKGKERLAIAQAEKATASEIFKLQEDNLKTEVRLLEKEVKLAKNRGDSEKLLEKQKALKDKQLELTVLQTQRETENKNLLEEGRKYLSDSVKTQKEKEELTAAERDRLKEIETEINNIQINQDAWARGVEKSAGNTKRQQFWMDKIKTDQKRLNELLPQQAELQEIINAKVEEYEKKQKEAARAKRKALKEQLDDQKEQIANAIELAKIDGDEEKKELRRREMQFEQDKKRLKELKASKEDLLAVEELYQIERAAIVQKYVDEQTKLEDELYKSSLTEREQEELALMQQYDQRIAIAGDNEGLIKAATEDLNKSLKKLNKKYRDEEIKKEKELQDAKIAVEDELYNLSLDDYEKQELALLQAYDARIAAAGDDEGLIKAATERLNKDLEKLEEDRISATNDMRVKMAVQSFQAIDALGKAFASKDEKDAKKTFKVQKALNLASATMSATEAVIQAYKTGQASPLTLLNPAYPAIQAGIAAAFGVAQVATIARTQYESPAQPTAGYGGGGASASAPSAAPQLDLGFLGAGGGQTGFRSYVIASEVSNSQQANQRINDQASLIG